LGPDHILGVRHANAGVAVLRWASGPDNPDAKNRTSYFLNYTNPRVSHCPPDVNPPWSHRTKPACHGNDANLLNYTVRAAQVN
jgi:hypothetical protein